MFVRAAENCPFEIDVCYNHVCVDGKSFLGLMGIRKGSRKICSSDTRCGMSAEKRRSAGFSSFFVDMCSMCSIIDAKVKAGDTNGKQTGKFIDSQ